MKMSGKMYDFLKWLAMFFLPALAVFVKTVFAIWNIPFGEEISSTIVALNAFLGMCLGISSINYQKSVKENKEKWDEL
jgi:ABC-type transport system involved in multi-copper enzyme maturation permease subunit